MGESQHDQQMVPPCRTKPVPDAATGWRLARMRAFQLHEHAFPVHDTEAAALLAARNWTTERHERLLRAVFDTSREFGLRLARFTGRPWTHAEIRTFVAEAGVPCFSGRWTDVDADAAVLARTQCPATPGVLACSYWREALDGLTMGLGDRARHARHRSIGHGDARCIDVLYDQSASQHRYGPIPNDLATAAAPVIERMAHNGTRLELIGYSTGSLFYTTSTSRGRPCGAGNGLLLTAFRNAVAKIVPRIEMIDATPRGVYGDS